MAGFDDLVKELKNMDDDKKVSLVRANKLKHYIEYNDMLVKALELGGRASWYKSELKKAGDKMKKELDKIKENK